MTKILLISDTHNYFEKKLIAHINEADEIWHAGDIGNLDLITQFKKLKPFKAVYGNADGQDVRIEFPKNLVFTCENVKIYMTHICGQPTNYLKEVKDILLDQKPKLFICGHSHILKVIFQQQFNVLHMNPGACGVQGFHQVKTALRFTINDTEIKDLAVIEFGNRA